MVPRVELHAVSVAFGSDVVLSEVSLSVAPGEIVALLGPSGCGKTTLLRAVAGLAPLHSGTVSFDGADIAGVPTHKRELGLMFQDHALFPHLDVAANVAFGLKMRGDSATDSRQRVGEVLDLVGLEGFGGRRVASLSGGEAQRVALARALAPEPTLLMLDEPLGSLDQTLRVELTRELRGMLSAVGQTAIHVTHDHREAFALADRVVVMRDGSIEAVGDPHELWRRPRNEFVARFLGHETIVDVEVSAEGALFWQGRHVGEVPTEPSDSPADFQGRRSARAVVPASAVSPAIAPSSDPAAPAPNTIPLVVTGVEYAGDSWRVAVSFGGDTLSVDWPSPVRPGDHLHAVVDTSRIHLLS
jgi:thiamine transport system ATP-binding protein